MNTPTNDGTRWERIDIDLRSESPALFTRRCPDANSIKWTVCRSHLQPNFHENFEQLPSNSIVALNCQWFAVKSQFHDRCTRNALLYLSQMCCVAHSGYVPFFVFQNTFPFHQYNSTSSFYIQFCRLHWFVCRAQAYLWEKVNLCMFQCFQRLVE